MVVAGLPTKWGASHRTVYFDCTPLTLAQWRNTIAVGLEDHYIAILDAITGIRVAAFSGHVGWVRSLAFSGDGTLLVSGGDDKTINLWDVQTGGVIKTLRGHTGRVLSVSVAPDRTAIVSGSSDGTIRLWNLQTRKDRIIRKDSSPFTSVSFSPKNSRHIISASEKDEVRLWDVDGQEIGPPHDGFEVAYSPDGAFFVSSVGTVRNSETGAEFKLGDPDLTFQHCCFSPDGRLVACATSNTVFVWDISGSVPSLVGNFVGHTEGITSLAFSSCLASASWDQTVKFWWISTSADQNTIDTIPTSPTSVRPIQSISLQAEHGIAITTDSVGMMKIWDLSTGHYEGPFETPARGNIDAQKIDGRVIVVWYDWKVGEPGKVHVWDLEKKELLRTFCERWARAFDLRISGDGSKVFLLDHRCIRGWFISTGKAVGEVELTEQLPRSLIVDGSKVWLSGSDPTRWGLPGSNPVGWDFGIAGSPPILLSDEHPHIPRFDFLDGARKNQKGPPRIEDTITGKRIFHLPERFAEVGTETNVRWNGRYLVVGHSSGEVLILDFSHVCPE
jgi:WD40 repeat protein